ncbi:Probable 39S ribosomal protein L24 mitochondrial [Babesia microti strain RI]|uniref:Probable 39S ribosomal protein L24 mitochondrial n=1 Tax=Babesia microti (strain RI) TaxID=1133968 RepID=A0A1R4ABV5_BABMR|nr:Probable 39S ribosomal protein L24 mitochondrial [Babesia microti strain RI]SJK86425.1 Probable 39S ribosomal protein L24 mitochondrial [Babesia microti strain RI]|eukprot:XP_021338583.1 Probable 39S ribosomal protein L24 mitochondrial [Babesia microti strain RI]
MLSYFQKCYSLAHTTFHFQLNAVRGPKIVHPRNIIRYWKYAKGDKVKVISGRDKGKIDEIIQCDRLRNQVKVRGCNMRKMVINGKRVEIEKKIHYSNVQLIDPTINEPTRISLKFDENNNPIRVSKKSGSVIPWPDKKEREFKTYEDGIKDTAPEVALAKTYDYRKDVEMMRFVRQTMTKYNRDQ